MNCPNCGTALAEGAHFCPNCGTQIAAAPGTPPRATLGSSATSEPAPTPGSGAYAGPPATSGASADAGQPAPSGAPSARSRAPLIAAAAVAAVLALAVIGGLVLWSRGGDDEARFDPVRADELAKSAMISTSDLPGQGWQQEDKDPDEGRASELFGEESDPACRSISERLDAVRRQNEADRAGEAVREFDLADPSPTSLDASMRVSVAIFRTGNGLDKALDEVRGALADRSMPGCFEDIFGGSGNASGGPSVTAKPVTAHATAPRSGVAQAFELTVRLPAGPGQAAQTETARLEFYYWRYGNAGVSVFAFGGPALTKGAAQAAVTKTQTALEREAGED